MTKTKIVRAALLAALTLSAACVPPKVMIGEQFMPNTNKVVRTSVKPTQEMGSKDNKVTLSSMYLQVCDTEGGAATNCNTTLVLENIVDYQPTYSGVK